MAKPTQPVKTAEEKKSEEKTADSTDVSAAPTTIKVKPETKGKLDTLKEMFKTDYDGTVARLIETMPKHLSNDEEVHLVMPVSKYRWLMAHQDSCDCRTCLNDAKV